MRKVKIVCTLGPATEGVPRLVELIEAGMDVARLNFSHGEYREHQAMFADVRAAAKQVGRPITVFADLCGPKIRVGKMQGGNMLHADYRKTMGHTIEYLVCDDEVTQFHESLRK